MKVQRQIKKLVALEWLNGFSLGGALWVFFLVGRGFSLAEVGFAEGFFHLTSFCCEIPSGMAADILGRKRSLIASQVSWILSAVCMILSSSMLGVCGAMFFSALGHNLSSGTREAMAYDTLLEAGREEEYLAISSRQNVGWRVSAAVAMLCAGISVRLGFRICYVLDIVTYLAAMVLTMQLYEPTVTQAQQAREEAVLVGLGARIKDCFVGAARFLRENPQSAAIMFRNAVIGALATLLGFYLQDALATHGTPAALLGPLLLFVTIGGAIGSKLAPFVKRMLSNRGVLVTCTMMVAAGYLMSATGFYPIMALGGFLSFTGDDCLQIITDARLNERIPSDQRATLISVSSMMFSIVMIILSPLLGALVTI